MKSTGKREEGKGQRGIAAGMHIVELEYSKIEELFQSIEPP